MNVPLVPSQMPSPKQTNETELNCHRPKQTANGKFDAFGTVITCFQSARRSSLMLPRYLLLRTSRTAPRAALVVSAA
jgi:hypothetical protein